MKEHTVVFAFDIGDFVTLKAVADGDPNEIPCLVVAIQQVAMDADGSDRQYYCRVLERSHWGGHIGHVAGPEISTGHRLYLEDELAPLPEAAKMFMLHGPE